MSRLYISPPDPDAPGSLDQTLDLMEMAVEISEMAGRSIGEQAAVLRRCRAVIERYAVTDDGTPPAEALRMLSLNQFQQVLSGVVRGGNPVPPASGEPSPSTSSEATAPHPVGSMSS